MFDFGVKIAILGLKVAYRCDKSTCKARASYLVWVPSYDVLKVDPWGLQPLVLLAIDTTGGSTKLIIRH